MSRAIAALAALIVLFALVPHRSSAQTSTLSAVSVARSSLSAGQAETVTVVARDLAGHPLPNAAVTLSVRFSPRTATYRLPRTDRSGRTSLTFWAPPGSRNGKVAVSVTIISGYLKQSLGAGFSLSSSPASSSPRPTPSATATVSPTPSESALTISALPPQATAPNPVYLVVHAVGPAGDEPGAAVTIKAAFKEGTVQVAGTTDQYGVATLRVDTGSARVNQTVSVAASVVWKGTTSRGSTHFEVAAPLPTATPAATPSPTATAPATMTGTPTPTWTPVAPLIAAPIMQTTITPTPAFTSTPTPFPTPTFTPTYTPIPTDTPTPAPTNTPTPLPTDTPTPLPNCPGSQDGCMQAMLDILNATRAQFGVAPLTINLTQSNGTGSCIGSYGHSVHMAQAGAISHDQFPADVCVLISPIGENVGQYSSGSELTDLQQMNNLMMNEPHDNATCAAYINHACNILNPKFQQVGIGIDSAGGRTWLTEDFLG